MRNPNGYGTVVKMTGNRRKPYACRKIVGWKEDGKPIIKYISYHKTRREAEKALADYNEDPYKLGNYTLEDIYEEWYKHQDDKSENTRQTYRSTWKKFDSLKNMKIQQIGRFELQEFFDNADFSKSTLKQTRVFLKTLIEYAVKRGILPISALNLLKAVEYKVSRETRYNPHSVISKEDRDALWQNKDDPNIQIILVYIYTGLRYSELYELAPENVHENYIEITKAKTPTGVRTVPIADKIKDMFPNAVKNVPAYATFWQWFHKILPNHQIHDTRHTFISMLAEAKVDDRTIKAIVGHKTKDITEIYTHISLETMLEAVNKI